MKNVSRSYEMKVSLKILFIRSSKIIVLTNKFMKEFVGSYKLCILW